VSDKPYWNREAPYINIMLDGCMYPGQKLVQFILSQKHIMEPKLVSLNLRKVLASGE